MSARDRTSATGRRQGASPARSGGAIRASARRTQAVREVAPVPGEGLVMGKVPLAARGVGLLLVLAGIAGAAGLVPTYLVVGGTQIDQSAGAGSVLVGMLVPLAHALVGAVLLSGAIPKFGLAYAGVAGALALGPLLIEIYRGSTSTDRPGVEVIAGNRVLTSAVEIGPGWVLGVVALGLTMLAGLVAALAWGRTLMEDGGALDPARSSLAGAAVLLGVSTVLCLALPAADVPARVVTDPATFMQTVVIQEGPQALLERPGLALLGGLLLVGAVVLSSVVAPSLRPRLAAVGGLLAVAVTVLAAGLAGLRDAASPDLEWTAPGIGLLLAGIGYVVLTGLAWRLRRG